ncbi:cyclase family protein [Halobacterium zhouii]|uniref:cyclase family protein n=1 Tax=Halobacterium zhouii TaxID=2902624 RepID=UPI001E4B9658|nr:cyclase family protein [Halobacterium zhouii]
MQLRDCSHDLESGRPYPGDPPVSVTPHASFEADGYRVADISCSTHSGTHVDAPSHMLADGKFLDEFSVEEFQFDAHLVDCTDHGEREAVGADAIPGAAGSTDVDLLVFHTGWSERWGRREYFDHPYLTERAAERCVDLDCDVGLDTASVDPTPTRNASDDEPSGYPAHAALLGADSLVVENLTNLAGLPERFTLHAYPIPVAADGAPVRAVAAFE